MSRRHYYFQSGVRAFACLAVFGLLTACGSENGGSPNPGAKSANGLAKQNEDELNVRGTLLSAQDDVEGIEVCALGDCDETDEDGQYSLSVPDGLFQGGDVLFTFSGDDIEAQAVAPDLPGGNQDVIVDFEIDGNTVRAVDVAAVPQAQTEDDEDNNEIGGDTAGDDVEIDGNLSSPDGGMENVTVCALGDCDETDGDGDYDLTIPPGVFGGGDVLFTFLGEGLNTQAVAPGLPGNDQDATVDFALRGNDIVPINVSATGTGNGADDDDEIVDDDEDEDDQNGAATEDDVEVTGTLSSSAGEDVEGVEVCALGDCADTDQDGRYILTVPQNVFAGGDVLFSFDGDDVETETIAPNLPGGNRDTTVDFEIRGENVVPTSVSTTHS